MANPDVGTEKKAGYSFPIARRLLRFASRARQNWLLRHQNRWNFSIHMVGIPLALGGLLAFALVPWPYALGCFLLGYFLQWVGHQIEGNDVGELIPIKRALGRPVVSIAPQYLANNQSEGPDTPTRLE